MRNTNKAMIIDPIAEARRYVTSMGYDGIHIKTICDDGFHIVNAIIDRWEKMIPSVAA